MTSFEVYKLFLALKNHFGNSNYDFFLYQGKTKANARSFSTKKDKYFYERLARRYDEKELQEFFVSCMIKNPDVWVGDMCRDVRHSENYMDWKRRKESMTYCFSEEVKKIAEEEPSFDQLFVCKRGEHPKLFDLYNERTITLETLLGIDLVTDCFDDWNTYLEDDIIWKDAYYLAKQYRPFLMMESKKNRFKNILRKEFSNG
jgi:hypothetical protein